MTLIKCYCRVQHFSTKIWMDTWMHSAETKFGRVHPDCHVALCCATVTPLWVAKHILNCIMIQILNMCCPRICFTTLRLCSDRSLKLPTLKLWMHTSSACHVYIIDLCMRKNTWKEKFKWADYWSTGPWHFLPCRLWGLGWSNKRKDNYFFGN